MRIILLISSLLIISSITYSQSKEDENVPYITKEGKFVYCNHKFKKRIKEEFDYARPFLYDFAIVAKELKHGVINQKGKEIVPLKFRNVSFKHSHFLINEHNKEGIYFAVNDDSAFFSIEGESFILQKTEVKNSENIPHKRKRIFSHEGKYGLVYGEDTLIKPIYHQLISNHHNEFLIAKTHEGFGIVTHQQEVVLPFEYSEIFFDHTNSLFIIKKEDAQNHCYFYHQSDEKNIYCDYTSLNWVFHDYYLVSNQENKNYYVNFYTGKEFVLAD